MKNRTPGPFAVIVTSSVLLSLAVGLACATDNAPMTPAYAAKRENFRKQNEQRITHDKRRAAAEALKAERLKVHNARQAVKQAKPESTDTK